MIEKSPGRDQIPEWILYTDVPPPRLQKDRPGRNSDRRRPQPTFTFLGGRAGSGRSWFTSPHGPIDRSGSIFLDVMEIVERLPEYQGGNAMLLYQEAYDIFLQAESKARSQMLNIIVKSTMRVKEEAEAWLRLYKQAGYSTCGYYMYASPKVAAERALRRWTEADARGEKAPYLKIGYILGSTTNEATFDALKPMLDLWALYENMGSAPTLVAKNSPE